MQIDDNLISYLEDLSCITLSDSEKDSLKKDLQKTMDSIAYIDRLDTRDVPCDSAVFHNNVNIFRDDEVKPFFDRELILKNAPVKNDEYFIAPKTLE